MIGLTFFDSGVLPSSVYKGTMFFLKKQTKSQRIIKFWSCPTSEGFISHVVRNETLIFGGTTEGPEYTYIYREFSGSFALFGPVRGIARLPDGDHPERGQEDPFNAPSGSRTQCNH